MNFLLLAQSEAAVEVDPAARITDGAEDALRAFLEQLPQIATAIVVLVLFVLLGKLVAKLVRKTLSTTTERSDSFLNVMSRIARGITVAIGFFIALVIAVPSVNVGSIIAGFGISSVAIGFAFKDILQNTLAGLLLLFRQPFKIGDQIEVGGHTGTVDEITIRETRLKTFDGQRILIPNSDVYSSSVRVQTAFEFKRTDIGVGVDYDEDLARAQNLALEAVRGVDGVASDPAPQALYTGLGDFTINFDVRFWSKSTQADVRVTQDKVVRAVADALNGAGVEMPNPITEIGARDSLREILMGQTRSTANTSTNGSSGQDQETAAAVPAPPQG